MLSQWQLEMNHVAQVVGVTDMTVDGGKLHVVSQDKRNGSTTKYDANRS